MSIGASLQWIFRRAGNNTRAEKGNQRSGSQQQDNSTLHGGLGLSERLMLQYRDTASDSALSSLYDLHSNKLFHFLIVMSDKHTAEDIVQKAWINVIEKRHSFTEATNFQAWLFTIGRNLLMDEFRRTSKFVYDNDGVMQATAKQSTENTQQAVDTPNLTELLRALEHKQKEALSLQLEGFSLIQISEICHIPKETVKTRLRYAKDNLKLLAERT